MNSEMQRDKVKERLSRESVPSEKRLRENKSQGRLDGASDTMRP